ncbi:zona pellucida sperm-binding protein 3-like [Pristis pectinata]|uniref:zona pellucida sperm-binding protein 3-like n=1 Tax=Pristis pectinata TaxID=685728 RepID=UPI00223E5A64|nr:zona pellucida sperm-binding protein 3-like [Pristis pectinata]
MVTLSYIIPGDWHVERNSSIYQVGDFIHIEASVTISCVPMRLYVDSCVATPSPDKDSTPRHHLIGFNGCLLDSRPTGSSSSFVSPRAHLNKLQIKLDVLQFLDAHSPLLNLKMNNCRRKGRFR